MESIEQTAFHLILHSGNARAMAFEAFDLAAAGDFAGAQAKLKEAKGALGQAHQHQTSLIQAEAGGEAISPSLLLIHAQDHLMTAMSELNLTERLIRVLELRR